jgi:hypothetical protein
LPLSTTHEDGIDDSKQENISFRLPKKTLDSLRNEAQEKRIDLNTLTDQVLDSYVNYVSSASKANMLPVSIAVLVELLEGYCDDHLKAIAERAQKKVRVDVPLLLRGEHNFESVIDTYEYWLKVGGLPYRHIRDQNNNNNNNKNRHTFIVRLDMGRKFSFFMAESSKAYFEPVVTRKIDYTITDNSVAITVEGPET